MDIFFQDPNIVRVPPEEVRLLDVKITPQPKVGRVKVFIELTPFTKRPNIRVSITDKSGEEVAHTSILETMLPKMEFTMHIRQPEPGSEYNADTWAYYQRIPEPSETGEEVPLPEPLIVDHHTVEFFLPLGGNHT